MEDIDSQRKGILILNHRVGVKDFAEYLYLYRIGKLSDNLPIRRAAIHVCHDDTSTILPVAAALVKSVKSESRTRIRFHKGRMSLSTTAPNMRSLRVSHALV